MITPEDIIAGYSNPAWEGHGYLREREHLTAPYAAFADAVAIEVANHRRWSRDRFFRWLNSPAGRHYGDWVTTLNERVLELRPREAAQHANVDQFFTDRPWSGKGARDKATEKHELTPRHWGMSRRRQHRPRWTGRSR